MRFNVVAPKDSVPSRSRVEDIAGGEVFLDGLDFGHGELAIVCDDFAKVASVIGKAAPEGNGQVAARPEFFDGGQVATLAREAAAAAC